MTACRWVATDQPRMVKRRHEDGCADETCAGCQPCTEPHCVVCGITHALGGCPGCVAEARDNLDAIVRMVDALPSEVAHRGINGEAMNLLGPIADVEAWQHHGASIRAGRIVPLGCDATEYDDVAAWLDQADHELHPLWVLGSWAMLWRDALEHDEGDQRVTVISEAEYLGRQLTYMAGYVDVSFDDFARDLRKCVSHMEAVLHDGERPERTRIPCLDCGRLLEVQYGDKVSDDRHVCPGCRRAYDSSEVTLAKADLLSRDEADRMVLVADAAQAIERSERTIRTWVNREKVMAACDVRTHRLLVWWPDVRHQHSEARLRELLRAAS